MLSTTISHERTPAIVPPRHRHDHERVEAPETLAPGSAAELRRFEELQRRLAPMFSRIFPDPLAPRTVVVVPSMSLDPRELEKLEGAAHYEERLLCMLLLLRMPRTNLVYVTSEPLAPSIIDYYLHLLPGVPPSHARRRLTLLYCGEGSSSRALTEKILARPQLLDRIRVAIPDPATAHLSCFRVTPLERTLAVRLGVPIYGCDPELDDLGTKSGSREVFRRAGVRMPNGFERLRDMDDVVAALSAIKRMNPSLRRAVVKLNDGFSGEGNAVFTYGDVAANLSLEGWIRRRLPTALCFAAPCEKWDAYSTKFAEMGGIVEEWVEGGVGGGPADVRSPSVQCRVDPLGRPSIISTHDQLLGGPSHQVYWGCSFPADSAYSHAIQEPAARVADVLSADGVLGRFGIDFLAVRRDGGWDVSAVEINLRKGGTTHPYLMLQFLTDGSYDPQTGAYHTPSGRPCHYVACDDLRAPSLLGLTPDDLLDIAVVNGLHYDAAAQEGVMFHMLGALREHGKVGMVCIGDSHAVADRYFHSATAALRRATA